MTLPNSGRTSSFPRTSKCSLPDLDLTNQLHLGEAEAIKLAHELRADLLIMDERRGRQIAAARGLTVIGTLGIFAGILSSQLDQQPHRFDTSRKTGQNLPHGRAAGSDCAPLSTDPTDSGA